MPYLNTTELSKVNFKHLGKNVLISDKAAIYNADQIAVSYTHLTLPTILLV